MKLSFRDSPPCASHWLMAVMVIAMLFIVGMVSVSEIGLAIDLHKPLGILILCWRPPGLPPAPPIRSGAAGHHRSGRKGRRTPRI